MLQSDETSYVGCSTTFIKEKDMHISSSMHLLTTFSKKKDMHTLIDNYSNPSHHLCEKHGMLKEGLFIEFVTFVKNETKLLIESFNNRWGNVSVLLFVIISILEELKVLDFLNYHQSSILIAGSNQ